MGSYRTYSSLVKLQPWFPRLRCKNCLRQNYSIGYWACSEVLPEYDDVLYYYIVCYVLCYISYRNTNIILAYYVRYFKRYVTSKCVFVMNAGFKNYQLSRVKVKPFSSTILYSYWQYYKKVIPFALRLEQNWHKTTSNFLFSPSFLIPAVYQGACGYQTRHWLRGSRVQTRPGSIDFSERKSPEYNFLRKENKAGGSRVVDLRHVKEPQAEIRACEQNLSDFSRSMQKATLMT